MSRPLTRSSSGKLGRNTRHSSKKSPHSLKNKNHVANRRGTLQIRRSISRESIQETNLATSRPKLALSDSSSKGKRLSYELDDLIDVPKTFIYPLRSQSENILETPIPQFRKRNLLIKSFQDELALNIRKGITEIEQSISTDFKRMTRSSMSNVDDKKLIKNKSHKSRLAISSLPKSKVKQIKCKTAVEVKEFSIANVSKRITRSSIGKVACDIFLKSRSSKDKLITLHQSTEKPVNSKTAIKEKETNVISENPKHISCSIGGKKNSSLDNTSMLKNVGKPVNSKHVAPSFRIITDFTPLVKKTPKCKILISPCPLSSQVGVGHKKSEKETVIIQKNSRPMKSSCLNKASLSLHSAKKECEKQYKTRNISPVSINSKKTAQMKIGESTSVNLMRNARIRTSGSLPVRELPKRNYKSSAFSKGLKRKPTGSPPKDKNKKNATLKTPYSHEDCVPLDCLTMDNPTKRPRRYTVDVCVNYEKASNPSVIQKRAEETSTTTRKTRSSKPKKGNSTLQQPNSRSSSAPDMSQLSIDSLTTFRSETQIIKKRPKSAPAGIKRKSKVAGLRTPIPRKGTLKRQRWMFNALKEKNEGYEDDIFENQKFQTPFHIINEVDDESDSSISTPKFGFLLTPSLPKKTPTYKEMISSSDLLLARKNAEEYLYRRNKKRTSDHSTLNSQASAACDEVPEKKKLEFAEVLEKVDTIRKDLEEKNQR